PAGPAVEPGRDRLPLSQRVPVRGLDKELGLAELGSRGVAADEPARLVPEEVSRLPLEVAAEEGRAATPVGQEFVGPGPAGAGEERLGVEPAEELTAGARLVSGPAVFAVATRAGVLGRQAAEEEVKAARHQNATLVPWPPPETGEGRQREEDVGRAL